MTMFQRNDFAHPDSEAGVFIDGLGRSLVTWAAMQQRTVTVAEAALAFNTTPDVIREVIEDASWIYVSNDDADPTKQTIELDGK
jgi:sugar/nucleoside kinase (ribokinase family)